MNDQVDADGGVPIIGTLPLTDLIHSDSWQLANAARRVVESNAETTYTAHGSSPNVIGITAPSSD
jgi:hypothetical protein